MTRLHGHMHKTRQKESTSDGMQCRERCMGWSGALQYSHQTLNIGGGPDVPIDCRLVFAKFQSVLTFWKHGLRCELARADGLCCSPWPKWFQSRHHTRNFTRGIDIYKAKTLQIGCHFDIQRPSSLTFRAVRSSFFPALKLETWLHPSLSSIWQALMI